MRLASILHMFIGSTLAGVAIVIALVTGHDTLPVLIGGAIAGYLVAVPVSILIARRLSDD